MQRGLDLDAICAYALRFDLAARKVGKLGEDRPRRLQRCGRKLRLDGFLAHRSHVGKSHAVGGEHASQRMNENARHAQSVGHQARMLPARAAETAQRIFGDVIASLDRDMLDRVGHVFHRDPKKAFGDLRRRAHAAAVLRDLCREIDKLGAHDFPVERQVAAGTEDLWK